MEFQGFDLKLNRNGDIHIFRFFIKKIKEKLKFMKIFDWINKHKSYWKSKAQTQEKLLSCVLIHMMKIKVFDLFSKQKEKKL